MHLRRGTHLGIIAGQFPCLLLGSAIPERITRSTGLLWAVMRTDLYQTIAGLPVFARIFIKLVFTSGKARKSFILAFLSTTWR